METIEERAMEKYWPDDFKQETVEKISAEVVSYITEQIESAINEKQQQAYKAYIAGAKDQQYISNLFIEQLIEKAWSLADSMYQVGKDHLTPLTHQEFIKEMEDIARALNK